jgi:hypothetical protein
MVIWRRADRVSASLRCDCGRTGPIGRQYIRADTSASANLHTDCIQMTLRRSSGGRTALAVRCLPSPIILDPMDHVPEHVNPYISLSIYSRSRESRESSGYKSATRSKASVKCCLVDSLDRRIAWSTRLKSAVHLASDAPSHLDHNQSVLDRNSASHAARQSIRLGMR